MNALHSAFRALGLESGATFEQVKARYKILALVWHPDRMEVDSRRREAEEELKRINNAFDLLKEHFDSVHSSRGSCSCITHSGCSSASVQRPDNSSPHQGTADGHRQGERSSTAASGKAQGWHHEPRRPGDAPVDRRGGHKYLCFEDEPLLWKIGAVLLVGHFLILLNGTLNMGIPADSIPARAHDDDRRQTDLPFHSPYRTFDSPGGGNDTTADDGVQQRKLRYWESLRLKAVRRAAAVAHMGKDEGQDEEYLQLLAEMSNVRTDIRPTTDPGLRIPIWDGIQRGGSPDLPAGSR